MRRRLRTALRARPYLVRAPVPEGRHGHSKQDPGPREVGGERVSEDVKGVFPGQPAAAVLRPVGGQGQEVLLRQALQPSDRSETCTPEAALAGGSERPQQEQGFGDSETPLRGQLPREVSTSRSQPFFVCLFLTPLGASMGCFSE